MRTEANFSVEGTVDPDGFLRLSVAGELDHVASESLLQQLEELKTSEKPIRLDLSELDFIDSSGVRALIVSVRDARREGRQLEVDPNVSWQVDRVLNVLGVNTLLWPVDQAATARPAQP